jgi:hypothetical protein
MSSHEVADSSLKLVNYFCDEQKLHLAPFPIRHIVANPKLLTR